MRGHDLTDQISGFRAPRTNFAFQRQGLLLDDEKAILKRVKQIPTSTQTVEEPKNPDECNVYNLCKLFLTPEEDEALRAKYLKGGLSFKEAKDYLFEKIMETLAPIQKKYAEISDEEIIKVLKK